MRLAKQRLRILLVFMVAVFAVWAKVDYAVTGYRGHYLPEDVLPKYWFWMWIMGVPAVSFVFALAYWTGAPKTKRNRKIAAAIFLTGIFLGIGQLKISSTSRLTVFPFHPESGHGFETHYSTKYLEHGQPRYISSGWVAGSQLSL